MPSRLGTAALAAARVQRLAALLVLCAGGCRANGCSRGQNTHDTALSAPSASASASVAPTSVETTPSVSAAAAPVRYGVSALSHLPKDCSAAARVEWKALANHPLFAALLRKALHPEPGTVATSEQKSFFAFLARSNLDLQRDVEQVALCFDRAAEPLVIVAGSLPKDVIVLLQELAPKSERYKLLNKDGVAALTRAGRSLAQADDRSLVMGPKLDQVLQARSIGSGYGEYALPETTEVAVVARGELISGLFLTFLPQPFGALAGRTERLQATFSLGTQELALMATLPSAEEAEVLKTSLSTLARDLTEQWKSAPPDPKGFALKQALTTALQGARWEVQDKALHLSVKVPVGALAMLVAAK